MTRYYLKDFKIIISAAIIIQLFTNINNVFAKSLNNISGIYINKTFLDQTAGKIAGTIPVYCFQMNLKMLVLFIRKIVTTLGL